MLDIVAIAITITGVIFNFFKNPMSWVCWMVANVWIIYFYGTDEKIIYMWMIFFILNCIGLYKWLKKGEPK